MSKWTYCRQKSKNALLSCNAFLFGLYHLVPLRLDDLSKGCLGDVAAIGLPQWGEGGSRSSADG